MTIAIDFDGTVAAHAGFPLIPRKIIAEVYIDDRMVGGWKGWPEVMRQISEAYCRLCDDVHWPQEAPCVYKGGPCV